MPTPEFQSGWLDDVAAAAVSGGSPIIFAVCQDLYGVQEVRDWLQSAIPSLAEAFVEEVAANELLERIQSFSRSGGLVSWVVYDSAEGNSEELRARWVRFNLLRDRLTDALRSYSPRACVLFLSTVARMPEIAQHAPDLLSVAQVITVSEEPFAVHLQDIPMRERFFEVSRELEARYGLSTQQLVQRLLNREPTGVPEPDLSRWRSLAQALREVEGPA